MATNGVNDIAYDCGTAYVRMHTTRFGGITKLSFPEEKLKVEKLNTVGGQYATIRTAGVVEVGDGEIEMTTVAWRHWLSKLPDNFGNVEFPITVAEVSPQVAGVPYSVIWDRVRILGTKQEIDNSEKAHRVTIPVSVIMLFHRGADGKFKTLARRTGQSGTRPSPAAQALMF